MPVPLCACEECTAARAENDEVDYECGECGAFYSLEIEAGECCNYSCPECGERYAYENEADECCEPRYFCNSCGEDYLDEDTARTCCEPVRGDDDDYPLLDPLDNVYALSVATLPNRPARACSIEQEIVSGGALAARLMYETGLAESYDLSAYNADCRPGRAIVKEDGSLPEDGAEVVYSRFRLDNPEHIQSLSEGLARMRQLKTLDLIESGESAGTHIHISATADGGNTFMPQDMAALHELFCHLEDMLYAIAACGWRTHRLSEYGDGYCKVLPKVSGKATAAKVAQCMRGDRYLGLNFGRIYECAQRCNCGACLVGDWSACDCGAMDRATIEWRLFNSSTKPETIHAWLLIAHALTAYAAQHELGTLDPTPIRSGNPESRWEQLTWLLNTAPFTDAERAVIREAAERSPGFGYTHDNY